MRWETRHTCGFWLLGESSRDVGLYMNGHFNLHIDDVLRCWMGSWIASCLVVHFFLIYFKILKLKYLEKFETFFYVFGYRFTTLSFVPYYHTTLVHSDSMAVFGSRVLPHKLTTYGIHNAPHETPDKSWMAVCICNVFMLGSVFRWRRARGTDLRREECFQQWFAIKDLMDWCLWWFSLIFFKKHLYFLKTFYNTASNL